MGTPVSSGILPAPAPVPAWAGEVPAPHHPGGAFVAAVIGVWLVAMLIFAIGWDIHTRLDVTHAPPPPPCVLAPSHGCLMPASGERVVRVTLSYNGDHAYVTNPMRTATP